LATSEPVASSGGHAVVQVVPPGAVFSAVQASWGPPGALLNPKPSPENV